MRAGAGAGGEVTTFGWARPASVEESTAAAAPFLRLSMTKVALPSPPLSLGGARSPPSRVRGCALPLLLLLLLRGLLLRCASLSSPTPSTPRRLCLLPPPLCTALSQPRGCRRRRRSPCARWCRRRSLFPPLTPPSPRSPRPTPPHRRAKRSAMSTPGHVSYTPSLLHTYTPLYPSPQLSHAPAHLSLSPLPCLLSVLAAVTSVVGVGFLTYYLLASSKRTKTKPTTPKSLSSERSGPLKSAIKSPSHPSSSPPPPPSTPPSSPPPPPYPTSPPPPSAPRGPIGQPSLHRCPAQSDSGPVRVTEHCHWRPSRRRTTTRRLEAADPLLRCPRCPPSSPVPCPSGASSRSGCWPSAPSTSPPRRWRRSSTASCDAQLRDMAVAWQPPGRGEGEGEGEGEALGRGGGGARRRRQAAASTSSASRVAQNLKDAALILPVFERMMGRERPASRTRSSSSSSPSLPCSAAGVTSAPSAQSGQGPPGLTRAIP